MFTFGGSSETSTPTRLSWGQMTETQKIAHSLKHGTNYASNADPAALAQAQRYLEKDGSPAKDNGNQDNLAQLYAEENTQAQQQEQAATNQHGMSNGQLAALQGYYDKGILDPATNQFTAEYLSNADNNDDLYEMYIGGFGLGDNDLHRALMAQAGAGWEELNKSDDPYDQGGLTFGGGSGSSSVSSSDATSNDYLQSVNDGLQEGIHGSSPGENPWAKPIEGSQGMFGQAYSQAKVSQPVAPPMPQPAPPQEMPKSTPYADAYIRARQAAERPNAVTSLFSKDLFN